jgi:hypothetical protein
MSSPYFYGSEMSTAFTSKDMTILSEVIHITIGEEGNTAKFVVEYTIQSDRQGVQIPLLFLAKDYKESFHVWLDNQSVSIQTIPEQYTHFQDSPFSGFSPLTKNDKSIKERDEVSIRWDKNNQSVYKLNELNYFETNISKGIHSIRVEYTAKVMTNISGWVKEYHLKYSLSPAKFWKSFGTLTIILEQKGKLRQVSTNIGQPIEKTVQTKNTWNFTKLPAEYLEFTYTSKINRLAKLLIAIHPIGLSLLAGILLFLVHLFFIRKYRKQFSSKKYSPIMILGSLLIPFLILVSFIYSFDLIDTIIGDEAGRYHSYLVLYLVLYPFILIPYWLLAWMIDRKYKQKLAKEKTNS